MNIILIHIGETKIDHIFNTIEHLKYYKNKNIFLLLNKKLLKKYKNKQLFKHVNLVDIEKFILTKQHSDFLKNTRINKNIQDAFWLKTLERFFYIDNFCSKLKLKNIIHLENDVLIFDNLNSFKNKLSKLCDIGLTFVNHKLCVPGIIYFKNYKYTNHLSNFIWSKNRFFFQKKNLTDMKILSKFFYEYKKIKIEMLPVLNEKIAKKLNIRNINNKSFYKNYKKLGVIFDACALGQKIDGLDPKYHKHKGSYINDQSIFDPSKIEIYIKNNKFIKRPYIKVDKQYIPILNIHMHSKRTFLFLKK